MSASLSPTAISVHPQPIDYPSHISQTYNPDESPPLSSASSLSSGSEVETNSFSSVRPASRKSRMDRPRMADRARSSSIIIPKGRDTYQREKPEYPPDDARAMSPRRNSEDLERLELGVRKSLQDQAHTLQSSLQALANRIDEVRQSRQEFEYEEREEMNASTTDTTITLFNLSSPFPDLATLLTIVPSLGHTFSWPLVNAERMIFIDFIDFIIVADQKQWLQPLHAQTVKEDN